MRTKKKKSAAARALEAITGPLTFGGMLEAIRQGEGESLAEFAKRLDVSRMYLHDIEKGRRGVSLERAAAWATLLGYGRAQFIELALQQLVDAAKLDYRVAIAETADGALNDNGRKPARSTVRAIRPGRAAHAS